MIFPPLVPFHSSSQSGDIFFHSLQRSPEWKIRASLPPHIFAERDCCCSKWMQTNSIMTAYTLAMKTPILMYCDKWSPKPDPLWAQSMGTMLIEFPRSLKRIANEKQSGSEKATKPCGVSLKLIGGELKEEGGGREGEDGSNWKEGLGVCVCVEGSGGLIQSLLSQLSHGSAFFRLSQPSLLPPP